MNVLMHPSPKLHSHTKKVAELTHGESVRGEVCAGSWVYHYFQVPRKSSLNTSLHFDIFAFDGSVDFAISEFHAVIYLIAF